MTPKFYVIQKQNHQIGMINNIMLMFKTNNKMLLNVVMIIIIVIYSILLKFSLLIIQFKHFITKMAMAYL